MGNEAVARRVRDLEGEAGDGRGRELLPRERSDLRDRNRDAAQTESGEAGIPEAADEDRDPVRTPLYDLRHTAATLGIAAGVSVKVISDQMGHA
jgi:integrase